MLKIAVCFILHWLSFESDALKHSNRFRRNANVSCILPPYPDNGRWTVFNGDASPGEMVPIASIISFECDHGYKLSIENALSVCTDQWRPSKFPECEKLCPPLYPSDRYELQCVNKLGMEIECSQATDGSSLEYTCSAFHETPVGYKKTLFCRNGKWSDPNPVCEPVCGKKIAYDKRPLIFGSAPEEEIVYPWVTAIYKKGNSTFENICGGSVLSPTIVLTAAHCVTNQYGDILPASDFMVGAGKLYNAYQAPQDTRAQYLGLEKIIVPQGYKGNVRNYAADIAVLVVKGQFNMTEVVQPVCFTNVKNIPLQAGHKGEVAGWGLAEGDLPSEVLRALEIPYKYDSVCAEELPPEFSDKYNLQDKICAGFINRSMSVCAGDSGSGLAFRYRENNRYYIHGIVSLAPKKDHLCDIQQNSLYTRVAFYYDFVEDLLTKFAPKIKDCRLPPYPENGKWTTDISDSKPGDVVPSSTVLTIECEEGFKLSFPVSNVECNAAYNMPTCEKLCPVLDFTQGTTSYCTNKEGNAINCAEAIDGSKVWYECPKPLQSVQFETNRTCVKGSWGIPQPECSGLPIDCGKVFTNGTDIDAQRYPWTIGIYKYSRKKKTYTYACAGSLISQRIVLTSAKCVTVKYESSFKIKSVLPQDIFSLTAGKIYGKYNDSRDTHVQYTKVASITVPPRYMVYKGYDSDLALLVAETPFTLNNYVQPVCIGKLEDDHWRKRKIGTISGWRGEGGGFSNKYEPLELRIVSTLPCNGYDRAEFFIYHDKICLEFVNETISSHATDEGKGFVLQNPKDGKYYVQAIATGDELYTVKSFTNLLLHVEFIDFVVNRLRIF